VKSRILVLLVSSILLFSFNFFSSCKKINEGTELGDDLLPVVDNVKTFDTSLAVQTYNDVFTGLNDSTRITPASEHFVGRIGNDLLFGKTDASIFIQIKPTTYPFAFQAKTDSMTSMTIDSVVLVLGYVETYGDPNVVQKFNVFEIDNTVPFRADSFYLVRQNSFTYSNSLTTTPVSITPKTLNDSVTLWREKAKGQLRIRLNDNFGTRLLTYDSTPGNAYHDDSTFNTKFKGFAIVPDGFSTGNALIGINLLDTNTKVAIYYKWYKNNGPIAADTVVRYFRPQGLSAQAQLVTRDHANTLSLGTPQIQNFLANLSTVEDSLVFIQNTPGTFAKVKIPGLGTLSNRVVHRAELIVDEVFDPSDTIFDPPEFLYLDAYDSAKAKYRTIPFDLGFDFSGNLNAGSFGMVGKPAIVNGNTITEWRLNLTRYVQHIVTNHNTSYELRLFSPNYLKEIYSSNESEQQFNVNPSVGKGRVRVGGGNHSTQRMRLRIIYSKI
jgi:hypothetical protein